MWKLPSHAQKPKEVLVKEITDDLAPGNIVYQTFVWVAVHAIECVRSLKEHEAKKTLWTQHVRPLKDLPISIFNKFAHRVAHWASFQMSDKTQYLTDGFLVSDASAVLHCSLVVAIAEQVDERTYELLAFLTARLCHRDTNSGRHRSRVSDQCWWLENDTYDGYKCGSTILYQETYQFLLKCRAARLFLQVSANNVKAKDIVEVALYPEQGVVGKFEDCHKKDKRYEKGSFYLLDGQSWDVTSVPQPKGAALVDLDIPTHVQVMLASKVCLHTWMDCRPRPRNNKGMVYAG